jgi:hypothetical protein
VPLKINNVASVAKIRACCRNCAYSIMDEAAMSYRCTLTYYKLPAVERFVPPIRTYPKVNDLDLCDDWNLME